MKKSVASTLAAGLLALSCTAAFGADMMPRKAAALPPAPPPSPWDIAFGGSVMSDYNFRGISQSNRGPSASAYFEPQFKTNIGTFYVGIAGYGIDWPSGPGYGFTAPSAEIDLYGGWRNSWGAFSMDIGALYYYYPKETWNGFTDQSNFFEIYGKFGYDFGSGFSAGANVFYTPDLLNYSETFTSIFGFSASKVDATYVSGTAKWVLPWTSGDFGAFVSGEFGHWFIADSNFIAAGLTDPSYSYWNVGLAFTYKAITLDLRYHGNDLGTTGCGSFLVTGVPNFSNNWCNDTFIASIKFDSTLSALK